MDFVGSYFGIEPKLLTPHIYEYRQENAVRHLFRVACSLDSMVIGEPQILGQVKSSYLAARSAGAIRGHLDKVLQRAFVVAKRVRTETQIGNSSVSIASVAVELARKIFGSLEGKKVLIVGAGKMSEQAARHLMDQGAGAVLVANRTHERAAQLAQRFGGRAIRFDDLYAQRRPGRYHHHLDRLCAAGLSPRTRAALSAAAAWAAHVLYRYRGAARRRS